MPTYIYVRARIYAYRYIYGCIHLCIDALAAALFGAILRNRAATPIVGLLR